MFSSTRRRTQVSLTTLSLVLVALSLLLKIGGKIWIKRYLADMSRSFSYVGDDYPGVWPIERNPVLMTFDNPQHFRLDEDDGAAEWSAIVPGDGLVHLGPQRQPYTISMMHQLRCLDIIRAETVSENSGVEHPPSLLVRHCLNYMRQMITCRGDLELESFQFASHTNPINLHGIYECKDWAAVYAEVKKNQEEYEQWMAQDY